MVWGVANHLSTRSLFLTACVLAAGVPMRAMALGRCGPAPYVPECNKAICSSDTGGWDLLPLAYGTSCNGGAGICDGDGSCMIAYGKITGYIDGAPSRAGQPRIVGHAQSTSRDRSTFTSTQEDRPGPARSSPRLPRASRANQPSRRLVTSAVVHTGSTFPSRRRWSASSSRRRSTCTGSRRLEPQMTCCPIRAPSSFPMAPSSATSTGSFPPHPTRSTSPVGHAPTEWPVRSTFTSMRADPRVPAPS